MATLLFEDGSAPVEQAFTIAASNRFNIVPHVHFAAAFPIGERRRFGMRVESVSVGDNQPAEIVVERAMFSDAGRVPWAAGNNAVATRLR